jgi:putative spermidine/putrescine transport system substrate-binding protein
VPVRRVAVAATVLALGLALTACAGSSTKGSTAGAGSGGAAGASFASATSAQAGGGMDALIAAAKKEGTLNVIALPRDWTNYGELLDGFAAKYGLKINNANPDGSSADELTAITSLKSQSRAPDVVDVGQSFAISGAKNGLYAPYQVATWKDIPGTLKESTGLWTNDYGGYISIGCDTSKVKACPTSLAALDDPAYKGKVALNGDPTKANAAFSAVWAAAVAKGGSLDDIKPGIALFKALKKAGIYVPVQASAATIQSGETPIVINWDYLNASEASALKAKGRAYSVAVPSDAKFAAYYAQAISKYAPHPAAARLWEEYLYSVQGQNGWLKGYGRPAELDALTTAKTINASYAAKLPPVRGTPTFPTSDQVTAAKAIVTQDWANAVK